MDLLKSVIRRNEDGNEVDKFGNEVLNKSEISAGTPERKKSAPAPSPMRRGI